MIHNTEFTPFDVQKEFSKNGFSWFTDGMVVCTFVADFWWVYNNNN